MGGANLVGGLASVIGVGGIPHVFSVTSGGGLWQFFGSWEGGWALQDVSNGGVLRGSPAAVYRDGRYDVFGIGQDGGVWQQTYTEGLPTWNPWRRVGGNDLVGGLNAVRLANGSFRVIGIDTAGGIQQFSSTTGTSWTSTDITNGGIVTGTPSMTVGANRLDVYAVGMDRQVWQEGSVNSGSWSGWQPIGGQIG
jgi:hypothetical protein